MKNTTYQYRGYTIECQRWKKNIGPCWFAYKTDDKQNDAEWVENLNTKKEVVREIDKKLGLRVII